MLQLSEDLLIGKGWHRQCYQHPDNRDLCIKIVVNGDDAETKREQAYYHHLQQRLSDWQFIPQFHGKVITNLGTGAVFDMVRNSDGSVAHTLAHFLEDQLEFQGNQKQLKSALARLYDYQIKYNILTMSLKPKNLLVQFDEFGQAHIHIIDNLGNAELIPLAKYVKWLGKRKIKRKWLRFEQLLQTNYPHLEQDLFNF